MSSLSHLDEFQKDIMKKIVANYKAYIENLNHGNPDDEVSMFFSILMYDTLKSKDYFHVEEAHIVTSNNTEIDFEIVYNKPLMVEDGQLDIDNLIDSETKSIKIKLIRFLDFILKLYNQGFIVLSDEEDEPTKEEAWERADYKNCINKGYKVELICFSSSRLKEFVDKYYHAAIIPTQLLIDFVKNKYLSNDEVKFRKSQRLGKIAILSSVLIAIASPLMMTKCSSSKINKTQFEKIINSIHVADSINGSQSNQIIMQLDSVKTEVRKIQKNEKTTNEKL